MNDDKNKTWYIIIIVILVIVVIVLLFVMSFTNVSQVETCPSLAGQYGMTINVDANVVNTCGQFRNQPCLFNSANLSGATQICNELGAGCSAFSFNEATGVVKIINSNPTFPASSINSFVKG